MKDLSRERAGGITSRILRNAYMMENFLGNYQQNKWMRNSDGKLPGEIPAE